MLKAKKEGGFKGVFDILVNLCRNDQKLAEDIQIIVKVERIACF